MSLKLTLARTAINSTGTEMYISDVTGNYVVETNEGGWGTPNELRGSTAIMFQAIYHKSTGDEDVEIVPYDPETVENITLLTLSDGYYEILVVAIPKGIPTVENTYGWIDGQIVQLVGGLLVPKTVKEVYEDTLFTSSTSFKTILLARTAIYRSRLNINLVTLMQSKNNDRAHNREIADLADKFDFVKGLLEGARYLWCSDNYVKAQLVVEAFDEILE